MNSARALACCPLGFFARLNARVAVCPIGTVCEKANVSVIQWAINFCKELVLCGSSVACTNTLRDRLESLQ